MLPSGIFVRTELDDLVASLPEGMVLHGRGGFSIRVIQGGDEQGREGALRVTRWSEDWCRIDVSGPEELAVTVVESLVRHEPDREVLSCHYRPRDSEYAYAFFRQGKVMETFESRGPSLDSIKFVSELRRVPLQGLLRSVDFMADALERFGVLTPSEEPSEGAQAVWFQVALPGKRTFWQKLLGAASRR